MQKLWCLLDGPERGVRDEACLKTYKLRPVQQGVTADLKCLPQLLRLLPASDYCLHTVGPLRVGAC